MALQFRICKSLSDADITSKLGLPVQILKHMQLPEGKHFLDLQVMDSKEQLWTLRYYTRPRGKPRPVFTMGWRQFVRVKKLKVDDELIFSGHLVRSADGELKMQCMIQVLRIPFTFQGEPLYQDVEDLL